MNLFTILKDKAKSMKIIYALDYFLLYIYK